MDNKIKIFVTYKEKHKILKSDIITPIQTGRAIADEVFDGMLGDDTGDNISILNPYFCETSAIYWTWKQYKEIGNPDYIGFIHYRRHFLFGNKNYKPNFFGLVKFNEINDIYLNYDLGSDEKIFDTIKNFDAIIPNEINIRETVNKKNNYEHYKFFHDIDDYKKTIEIIKDKTPDMMKYVEEYNNSENGYFLDMFIFKKEIFFDYCNWLFTILFELFEKIDLKNNTYQDRVLGFISERLTGIYITKLLHSESKIKKLPVSFIENTDSTKISKNENNIIPIAVACSNEYVPQLSVFVESIKNNSNHNYTYEINVLERNITSENIKILRAQFENSNIIFNFIHLNIPLDSLKQKCINKHYSVDTFSRFYIPRLLSQYDKCIYCDLDTIILGNLQELYGTDLDNKSLAAVRDWVFLGLCKDRIIKNIKNYALKKLKLENCNDYFQGGVQVMNLKKMRENNTEKALCELAIKMNVYFVDQCLFNYYFRNDVKYLTREWNYQVNDRERKNFKLLYSTPISVIQEVILAQKNPKIIHYSGPWKPWYYPDEEYADIWWQYARKTPFYEEFLKRMCQYQSNSTLHNCISDIKQYKINVLKYWKYKFFKNFVWGKTKSRYGFKKKLYKNKIRHAKQFFK